MTQQVLIQADAAHIPVPDGYFHVCITSPPYYGLRAYSGIEPTEWPAVTYTPMPGLAPVTVPGCAAGCRHEWGDDPRKHPMDRNGQYGGGKQLTNAGTINAEATDMGSWCSLCGGWRGCLGLEPTVEMYVAHLVLVFREVWRVLREDGVLWLNLGSSYASGGSYPSQSRPVRRGSAYDSDGIEQSGCQATDPAYPRCDDARQVGCPIRHRRTPHSDQGLCEADGHPSQTGRDSGHQDCEQASPDAWPHDVQASTIPGSSVQPPGGCSRWENCDACQSELQTFDACAPPCAHRMACPCGLPRDAVAIQGQHPGTFGNASIDDASDHHKSDRASGSCSLAEPPIVEPEYTTERQKGKFKPKDLVPTPWMVAMALQADGWYLRSDAPWVKSNPMPSSQQDRPTVAHEYWFLLTKSARYHYDAEAVKMPMLSSSEQRYDYAFGGEKNEILKATDQPTAVVGTRAPTGGRTRRTSDFFRESLDATIAHLQHVRDNGGMLMDADGLPLALLFNTKGYKGAHFATFNVDLIRPMVRASVSERGCCPTCGAAWVRVVERERRPTRPGNPIKADMSRNDGGRADRIETSTVTLGWEPSCDCSQPGHPQLDEVPHPVPFDPVPCRILDPFVGSGTTLIVARAEGCDGVGLDLSGTYLRDQARKRLQLDALDAWENGIKAEDDCEPLDALPLFASLT